MYQTYLGAKRKDCHGQHRSVSHLTRYGQEARILRIGPLDKILRL
jgi:hypothetical protein